MVSGDGGHGDPLGGHNGTYTVYRVLWGIALHGTVWDRVPIMVPQELTPMLMVAMAGMDPLICSR